MPTPEMYISIDSSLWAAHLPEAELLAEEAVTATLLYLGIAQNAVLEGIEVSVMLADDAVLQGLNRGYRGKDKPTNVLSFPAETLVAGVYDALEGHIVLGDIALAFETLNREAKELEIPLKQHFLHLMVHGMLHLLGYDHELGAREAEKMERLEVAILEGLNVPSPYEGRV